MQWSKVDGGQVPQQQQTPAHSNLSALLDGEAEDDRSARTVLGGAEGQIQTANVQSRLRLSKMTQREKKHHRHLLPT